VVAPKVAPICVGVGSGAILSREDFSFDVATERIGLGKTKITRLAGKSNQGGIFIEEYGSVPCKLRRWLNDSSLQ